MKKLIASGDLATGEHITHKKKRPDSGRQTNDESDGYHLITRLIEARNVLTMAAQSIEYSGYKHGHRAIDELDQACIHITLAIESL